MIDYGELLDLVPEALELIAHGMTPGAVPLEARVSGSAEQRTPVDPRGPIERILTVLAGAADATRALTEAFAEIEPVPVDQWESVAPDFSIADDPLGGVRAAAPLIALIREHLPELEAHPAGYLVTDRLDELVPLVRVVRARRPGARSKPCASCSMGRAWADLEHASAVCDSCGAVHRADLWLSVRETAARLGVDARTVRRWVADGLVPARSAGSTSVVNYTAAREHHDLAKGRALLNLPNVRG